MKDIFSEINLINRIFFFSAISSISVLNIPESLITRYSFDVIYIQSHQLSMLQGERRSWHLHRPPQEEFEQQLFEILTFFLTHNLSFIKKKTHFIFVPQIESHSFDLVNWIDRELTDWERALKEKSPKFRKRRLRETHSPTWLYKQLRNFKIHIIIHQTNNQEQPTYTLENEISSRSFIDLLTISLLHRLRPATW